jgi:hypothetical protein
MFAVAALAIASLAFTAPVMAEKCPTPEEIAAALEAAKAYAPEYTNAEKKEILGAINVIGAGLPALSNSEKKAIGQAIHDAKASGNYGGVGGLAGCKACSSAAAAKGL